MSTCVLRHYAPSTVLLLKRFSNFADGANRVRFVGEDFGGQMRGTNSNQFRQSLEETVPASANKQAYVS